MSHRFVIADVFTATAFGGNQLAIFPDARGLSDQAMQALTREFNFAESTFVLPPDDPRHTHRLRIFTPGMEVPFAGHPTVGTAAALVRLGLVEATDGAATVVFEENVGPIAVEVHLDGDSTMAQLTLETGIESPGTGPDVVDAAAVLSMPRETVLDAWFASAGMPFCFVRLVDRTAVDRAVLDRASWSAHFAGAWSPCIYLFAGDTRTEGGLYARMFAPTLGIVEDPATGSACAALAGALAERLPEPDGQFAWRIEQGVAMGRPSLIEAKVEKRDGRAATIKVGGSTVIVGEGVMTVPPGF